MLILIKIRKGISTAAERIKLENSLIHGPNPVSARVNSNATVEAVVAVAASTNSSNYWLAEARER